MSIALISLGRNIPAPRDMSHVSSTPTKMQGQARPRFPHPGCSLHQLTFADCFAAPVPSPSGTRAWLRAALRPPGAVPGRCGGPELASGLLGEDPIHKVKNPKTCP